MAAPFSGLLLLLLFLLFSPNKTILPAQASYCVVRSDASTQALQTAIDYACGAGADCAPLQSTGLCFLPNTIQAHASYAFNSYYQRKAMAPGSCDFAGTATIAQTDPSYGSCVYPSSTSTAGGATTPTTLSTFPNPPAMPTTTTTTTTPVYNNGDAGTNPSTTTDDSKASKDFTVPTIFITILFIFIFIFITTSAL